MSEWTLPANVAAGSLDAPWLDTFEVETRQLIAPAPDASPPYTSEEDFRRRALCWRDAVVRV
ncbi:MAG: hypothetical protein ABI877_00735, partial [Gemmatimonadaceae bacterium]